MAKLSKPTPEDLSKIHSEVNQIVHQRFLVCTAAITLFAVVIAWFVPKEPPPQNSPIGGFYLCIAALLSILLFSLFILHMSLKRMMRIFTTYLIKTNSSIWEKDYKRFRTSPYSAYTKPQTCLFLILNVATISFPYILALIYSLKFEPILGELIQLTIGVITIFFMIGMGFCGLFDNEKSAKERWGALEG